MPDVSLDLDLASIEVEATRAQTTVEVTSPKIELAIAVDTAQVEVARPQAGVDIRVDMPAVEIGVPGLDQGALTLDELDDVAITGQEDGDVLTYDLASDLWVPRAGGGGGAVGSWISNKTVTWTIPPYAETDLQATPKALPLTKPVTAQIEFTVTAGMLCTSSDAADAEPVGFENMLVVTATTKHAAMVGTAGTLSFELQRNGLLIQSVNDGGHANTERGNVNCATPVVAGDVIRVFLWMSGVTTPGSVLDWWGRAVVPGRLFKATPPEGGRYVYRDIQVTATVPTFTPAAVLTTLGTWTQVPSSASVRAYDAGVDIGNAVDPARIHLSDPTFGIVRHYGSDYLTPTASDTTVPYYPSLAQCPAQVRFDRLAIPQPPV